MLSLHEFAKRYHFGIAVAVTAALVAVGILRSQSSASGMQHVDAAMIASSCNSSNPCLQWTNTGKGPAIRGESESGNGVGGAASHNSTSVSNGLAGVEGNDTSTSGAFNSGVRGFSTRGIGVAGQSQSGPGILAESKSGPAVEAQTAGGIAVEALSDGGTALVADSAASDGDAIHATAGPGQGLNVTNSSAHFDTADFVNSVGGAEVRIGESQGLAVGAFGDAPRGSEVPALEVGCENGAPAIIAFAANIGQDVMSLDCLGNMILSGTLTQSGTPLAARHTAAGTAVGTFSAQQTTPTVEDLGEGQIVNGRGYVKLAQDFAATIDRQTKYLVFITPQGESRGLYVAQKTSTGFAVRENSGGSSTLEFDYRIVAKPLGEVARRLPVLHMNMRPDPSMMALARNSNRGGAEASVAFKRRQ